jgi:hypothetical protein
MCIDISHLVLESLCNTNDQVVDQGSDCAEGSDVLASTVVQLDINDILLWVGEVDSQMIEVLCELAYPAISSSFPQFFLDSFHTSWALDGDISRLNGDLDCLCKSVLEISTTCAGLFWWKCDIVNWFWRVDNVELTPFWYGQTLGGMNVLHFDLLPCRRRITEGFQEFEIAKFDIQVVVCGF